MWQEISSDGHSGSRVVARLETMSFGDDMVTATGSMLMDVPYAVIEQIEAGVIGPSVDLDDVEYVVDDMGNQIITQGRISGATLVAIPAFPGVSITLDPLPVEPMAEDVQAPAYELFKAELMTFASQTQERLQAPLRPPAEWFTAPDLDRLTPLTVSDTGRVFGHIAGWETEHVGLPGVRPPRSRNGYASFHVASQVTQEGTELAVGTLVTGPQHAEPQLAFKAAQQHYDDLSCAVAKVVAGEDQYGIWVSGWMLPGADAAKVEQFMSTPVSGDWRRVGGGLELIAVCSVNVPGFPIPRARVAFAAQTQKTLVAAFGITPSRGPEPVREEHGRSAPETVSGARAKWAWAEAMEGTE
jgi:hypothetical protein